MRSRLHSFARATCVLVACVAAASIMAGCTARQSQEQYEERLAQAIKLRDEVSAKLSAEEYESAADYDAASEQVVGAVDELDADPPPRNLQDAHDRMLEGLDGLAILLDKLGRCEQLLQASEQDRRVCRQSIDQAVFDSIRNDFTEANTIYREEGLSLKGLGGDDAEQDSLGESPEGGDQL